MLDCVIKPKEFTSSINQYTVSGFDEKRVCITTSSIIEETANALSNPKFRESVKTFYRNIRRSPRVTILHVDPELWEKGWRLFSNRDDKYWSFTDCVSFVVMNERRIKNALTSDKHFIQAGFSAMMQN